MFPLSLTPRSSECQLCFRLMGHSWETCFHGKISFTCKRKWTTQLFDNSSNCTLFICACFCVCYTFMRKLKKNIWRTQTNCKWRIQLYTYKFFESHNYILFIFVIIFLVKLLVQSMGLMNADWNLIHSHAQTYTHTYICFHIHRTIKY